MVKIIKGFYSPCRDRINYIIVTKQMVNLTNKCEFGIVQFSYEPKKKKPGLPETVEEFKELVWSKSKNHLDEYPKWFQKEFMDYWLTVPDTGTKCRYFLLPKKDRQKWSTLGRMSTVKRTIFRNDLRWKQHEEKSNVYPGKFQFTNERSNKVRQIGDIVR